MVKVANRPSLAVVHSGLYTLPSISPAGWSPSDPDEKGCIAPQETAADRGVWWMASTEQLLVADN